MKPKLEDVLFFNTVDYSANIPSIKTCNNVCCAQRSLKQLKKLLREKLNDETIEQMIIDDLSGKYFSGYVKYFKSNYKDSLDKSVKNCQKSVRARIKANGLLSKKIHSTQEIHKEIWELYCQSILFAPVGSNELVLGYESRSNLLLHLKKYEDCVKDIDQALSLTGFYPLKVKLLCRKMTCFVAMGKSIDEKENLWMTIKHHFEKTDGLFKDEKFIKLIKQARNDCCSQPNKETEKEEIHSLPLSSNPNLSMIYNEGKRVFVANQDFLPGDVIVVTNSLITSTNPGKCYAYCSHCLSFMWAGIPCNECSLCMYCSEKCKQEAWDKYHILECKLLPHINFDDAIYFDFHSTIRLFIIGLKEFGSISKLKEQMLNIDKLKGDSKLVKNSKLFDSDFLNFYISTNAIESSNINKEIKNTCFLMAYVIQTCDIFGKDVKLMKGKELAKDKIFIDLGYVLLKIYASCRICTLHPTQIHLERENCNLCVKSGKLSCRNCCKGTIFDPFRPMFKYSCNPNTSVCWTDDGKLIYYCVQPINKMNTITCTTVEFYKFKLSERNVVTGCECPPCVKDWPVMDVLYKKYEQRRKKRNTLETELVQKYLEKNDFQTASVDQRNCVFTWEEFEQLKIDVNHVVKVCGQPSFASSFMISFLCKTMEKFYGTIPLLSHIPACC